MKIKLAALSCLLLSTLAFSAFSSANQPIAEPIKQGLAKLGLTATSVKQSKVGGLLEVVTDRGLFYITENGQYLVHGKMFDIKDDIVNETENSLTKVRVAGVQEFKDSMITFPAKNEQHRVTVFTDTTCGYCRKMHSQMQAYNDLGITVQYLAFPRSGVQGPTFKELNAIWCADNQQQSLTKAKNGERMDLAKVKSCQAPIAEHYALGMKVGVNGTPSIVLENGTMLPGYQDPEQLKQVLTATP